MTGLVPISLLRADDDELVVDTVYFAIRILRNSRRGYTELAASTEPDQKVRDLTRQVVSEIEDKEGTPVLGLEARRIEEYINALEAFSSARAIGHRRLSEGTGASILKELRDSGL